MSYSRQAEATSQASNRWSIVLERDPDPGTAEKRAKDLRARLLRSVRRFCPPRLSDHVEDITQVALMRVLAVERADSGKTITAAYLERVAYGCTIDEIRRQRRVPEGLPDGDADPPSPGARSDPERRAHAGSIASGILDCLDALVPPRRRAVTLYLVGHTAPAIGRRFGWATKKTESLIYRGLANLRGCLRAKGLEP